MLNNLRRHDATTKQIIMNKPPQQPQQPSPETPRLKLNLDDMHLELDLGNIDFGRPKVDTPRVPDVQRAPTRRAPETVQLQPGLVYADTYGTELAALETRKILEGKIQDRKTHHRGLLDEVRLFRELSQQRLEEDRNVTGVATDLSGWVDKTAEQLAIAKSKERELVGQRAQAAESFGTAVSRVEANENTARASRLVLRRIQSEVGGLVDKQNEAIDERQKILDDIEDYELLKQRHQQRGIELSREETTDGTKIDVSNTADPNGLSDSERKEYQVPEELNYKIQEGIAADRYRQRKEIDPNTRINPHTILNPRTEIYYVRKYIDDELVPEIDRTIDWLINHELLRYDDNILPGIKRQLKQKIAEQDAMAADMRADEGSVADSQMAANALRHVFEFAYDAEQRAKARLGELDDAQKELGKRAKLLPDPDSTPTSALMLIKLFGDRGEDAVAQLELESPGRQTAVSGSGGQHTEQLAITAGEPTARSVTLGGLARRLARQLRPSEVAKALADKALNRDVVSKIETDD